MNDVITAPQCGYYINKKGGGGITASTLKIIAIVAMVIDHAAVVFLTPYIPDPWGPGSEMYTLCKVLRIIGRAGFPIFAFLIAEGARRTHNMPKYMLRLFLFGLVSEIPFDCVLINKSTGFFNIYHSNVYFTLLLGLCAICCIQKFRESSSPFRFLFISGIAGCLIAAWVMTTDYNFQGVIAIILFYLFSDKKGHIKALGYILAVVVISISLPTIENVIKYYTGTLMTLPGIKLNDTEIFAILSVPLLTHYNGKKGIHINKYFFYGFYPAHIILLGLIYTIIS